MNIKFYGTRGSIPVPERGFMDFGGNTSCVRVTLARGQIIIFDAGTGIRQLGKDMIASSHEQLDADFIPIVLSHTHWDHVQGFPFFGPAYDPTRKFTITICGKDCLCSDLEGVFEAQMQADFFPVPLREMGAEFEFWQPDISGYTGELGNHWQFLRHNHPGGAYSYRFTEGDKRSSTAPTSSTAMG